MQGNILTFIFPVLGVAWIAWLLCALFSRRVAKGIRRRPWLHAAWFLSVPVSLFLFVPEWRPIWLERHEQRRRVLERVRSVGGWEVLRKDCILLAQHHGEEGLRWSRTNDTGLSLTRAVATLEPIDLRYDPIEVPGTNVNILRLKLFGENRGSNRPVPYYGLEVVFGPDAGSYQPQPQRALPGEGYSTFVKIAENIYELY